jgi:ATP-dependent Clp protease ATP-binding subunit ClpX
MAEDDKADSKSTRYPRYPGWCSFCRQNHKEVGPLVEGPDQVYICFKCALWAASVISGECERLGIALPNT